MSSDLRQLIGFLLEKSDEKKLVFVANNLQGERIFQVLPRVLVTPFFKWEPSLYAESSLGSYEEINFPKKEADKLIESKYPKARVVISTEGKKYLVDVVTKYRGQVPESNSTNIYEVSKNEKKVTLLFSIPQEVGLLLVDAGRFAIHNSEPGGTVLEIWTKKQNKFVLLSGTNMFTHGHLFPISKNQVIFRDFNNNYRIFTFKPDNTVVQESQEEKLYYDKNQEEVEDMQYIPWVIPLSSKEFVFFFYGKIRIFEIGGNGNIFDKQVIKVIPKEGFLIRITDNLFAANLEIGVKSPGLEVYRSNYEIRLFRRRSRKEEFSVFQVLRERDDFSSKVRLFPPGKSEILRLARLLPCPQLPLDLKIATTEFCVAT